MPAATDPATAQADRDRDFMAEAVRLSLQNRGLTGENPSVGAVIVRDASSGPQIVGRGVTAPGGRPHAELLALLEAGDAARGATVYSTLEPCSHIGRAPPCADALVAAGVRRVVIACMDPDRRVAGRGVGILERAGIEVVTGCLEAQARRAMEGFLSLKGRGRPYLTLKLAVSADGMIGRAGEPQVPVTGPAARKAVQMMRVAHEAIMVGVGTVVADDPLLTVRLEGLEDRSPVRVVIDPFGRTPTSVRMLADGAARVIVLASEKASRRDIDRLQSVGAAVHTIASDYRGRFAPAEILRALGVLGLKSVLLEGGAETARRFLETQAIDRIALFTGSTDIGPDGVAAPLTETTIPSGFVETKRERYGADRLAEYERQP